LFKKILFGLIVLCLLSVSSLSVAGITYEEINVEIYENQYITRQIDIENTLDQPIDVTIETDMPITFSQQSFQLNINETETVTLYLFGETSTGYINISYENETDIIPVTITAVKQNNNINNSLNITIFPNIPTGGELFVIALPEAEDISGFLWINNKIYPIEIKQGFAVIETEKTTYGEAQLWLYNKGFVYSFDINCGLEGDATIETVDTVKVNEILEIFLSVGGKSITNEKITLQDPDGLQHIYYTDNEGKIYPFVNKIGEWIIKASFKNKQFIKKTIVTYKNLPLTIDKETINLGETITVTIDENTEAYATIKKEGIVQFQNKVEYGVLKFTPITSGSYTVEIESGDKKGSTTFKVNMQTNIRILDKNNMQTSIIKQGAEYIIQVIDENNQPITIYQSIKAEKKYQEIQLLESGNPYSEPLITIPLNNGLGFWQPEIHGQYTLSVENIGNYIGSSIEINIEQKPIVEETDMTLTYILVGVTVALGIIILLSLLIKKGIITMPSLPKRKKIPDNLL